MMERNHRNAYGRNRVASLTDKESTNEFATESASASEHCGFPRKLPLNDNPDCDSSDGFVPYIITRMPDLTRYGPVTAPPDISFYRPKHSHWRINFEVIKKLSLRKWGALLVIVVTVFAWSFFRGSDSRQVAQNTRPGMAEMGNKSVQSEPSQSTSTQVLNGYLFDGFDHNASSSCAFDNQATIYSSATVPSGMQNPYFRQQSIVQADTSPHDLPPWDRQPNSTASMPTQAPSQFGLPDFSRNSDIAMPGTVVVNNTPNSDWSGINQADRGNLQWSNNNFLSNNEMMGSPEHALPQNTNQQVSFQSNMLSQNGQNQPVFQPLDYNGGMAEYNSSSPRNSSGMIVGGTQPNGGFNGGTAPNPSIVLDNRQLNQYQFASDQQQYSSVSRQLADGFGTEPQQTYYQQFPVGHDNAIAINVTNNNTPSYPTQQGQWPPQNTGNLPQNTGMQNSSNLNSLASQQSFSVNGSQYAMQENIAQQPVMSNVPMMISGQSYPASPTTINQYSNQYPVSQQHQPFPHNNMAVSPTQEFYR